MGDSAQKRLIRKLDLDRFISKIRPHPQPNVSLEQYTTSESVASAMLYLTAYLNGDIADKTILDLGCGTGRLALACAFLGAKSVLGIDIDRTAINVAVENSKKVTTDVEVEWILGDIDAIIGKYDTVVQNPPFGVQKRSADRKFLEKALQVGKVVYSLHNHPYSDKQLIGRLKSSGGRLLQVEASSYLNHFIEQRGGTVEAVYALPFIIPHMFDFHTREKHEVVIDLYVIRKRDDAVL